MKLQGLAIIFIIIVLPITIIISEFAITQKNILTTERLYDSRLVTATYDGLKAFQINTFNDATSDIADSKINSIEASVNAFYNSMESSFGLEGYSKEELKMYVPALVYTMYDGYYIYSPYTNIATIVDKEDANSGNDLDDEYKEQELKVDLESENIDYGFKPYVYYSCRYVKNDIDVVINYALDNYITVQGTISGKPVDQETGGYKAGYLLTIANSKGDEGLYREKLENGTYKYYYSGIEILQEEALEDSLVEKDSTGNIVNKQYKYIKLNGTKYYWDEANEYIFYIMGESRIKQVTKATNEPEYNEYINKIQANNSAINYYENAYEFTQWVNSNLGDLTPGDAQIEDNKSGVKNSGKGSIFENKQIEYPGSNFNLQRKEVIRYSIESNLSAAIANFNGYTKSGTNFQMPKLKETEWEMLENEISIISFMQGINLGGKIYNGYTVVTNNKTEEVVKEDRIYITVDENNDNIPDYYHKINDKHLTNDFAQNLQKDNIIAGVLDLDLELRKDGATGVQYMQKNILGCYTSVVGQENVDTTYDSIYEYLQKTNNSNEVIKKVKQLYYTVLGRERWGTYKVQNLSNINEFFLVTDGLIRHYEGNNINSNDSNTWKDLSGNYDGVIHGATVNDGYVSFDGIDDWVNIGTINDKTTITLEAKIKLNSIQSDYATIMGNYQDGGMGLTLLNGVPYFQVYVNGNYQEVGGDKALDTNTVYNITGTYDGSKISIYINGVLKSTKAVSGAIKNPDPDTVMAIAVNPVRIYPNIEFGNINVYSARVYEKALTQEQIQQNIKATETNMK